MRGPIISLCDWMALKLLLIFEERSLPPLRLGEKAPNLLQGLEEQAASS